METYFTSWIWICGRTMLHYHSQLEVFSVCGTRWIPVKVPCSILFFICRFKVLSVWHWKQYSYFMDFTSKRTIHTSFSIFSFLTMGCSTTVFLSQPQINCKYTCLNRTMKFWPQWHIFCTISLSCPSVTQHLFIPVVSYWKFPTLLYPRMWDMMLCNCRNVSQHFEALVSFKISGTAHPVTLTHTPASPACADFLLNQTGKLQNILRYFSFSVLFLWYLHDINQMLLQNTDSYCVTVAYKY